MAGKALLRIAHAFESTGHYNRVSRLWMRHHRHVDSIDFPEHLRRNDLGRHTASNHAAAVDRNDIVAEADSHVDVVQDDYDPEASSFR
jgi:hypothetical protein